MTELIEAGRTGYDEMLNLVVWVKSNADQGVRYRDQHELIEVPTSIIAGSFHVHKIKTLADFCRSLWREKFDQHSQSPH